LNTDRRRVLLRHR